MCFRSFFCIYLFYFFVIFLPSFLSVLMPSADSRLVTKSDTWGEGELRASAACLARDVPSIQIEKN